MSAGNHIMPQCSWEGIVVLLGVLGLGGVLTVWAQWVALAGGAGVGVGQRALEKPEQRQGNDDQGHGAVVAVKKRKGFAEHLVRPLRPTTLR